MEKHSWLVTGAAGFIGSHLVEKLLSDGQNVVGLDNFSTGKEENISQVMQLVGSEKAANFRMIMGDIRNSDVCAEACCSVDYVLHHAALASVPYSMSNPVETHEVNVTGFLNMLVAARDAKIKRFVYASSSAVYGTDSHLPKVESRTGAPLSPYAASKSINEVYAAMFTQIYGLDCIGLRYFNVFGPRQSPDGAYAAVIPRWFKALADGEDVVIYGDGENTRDFCFVRDIVLANVLSATTDNQRAFGEAFNVGLGRQTSLNDLYEIVKKTVDPKSTRRPRYEAFREGDIRHSVADVSKIQSILGFNPRFTLDTGLTESKQWYKENL